MLLLPALIAATVRLDGALTEPCAEVGGLRSWLCHLSFDIPDEHLVVDSFHVDLEEMRCGRVLLGELSSSTSAAGAPTPTFRLGVQDLGLNCTVGRFRFKKFLISGSGTATVLVRSATLETGVELQLGPDGLALAAQQVAHPSMAIGELELALHGSVLVEIADAFKAPIARALQRQLPAPILATLGGLIAHNLTGALLALEAEDRVLDPPELWRNWWRRGQRRRGWRWSAQRGRGRPAQGERAAHLHPGAGVPRGSREEQLRDFAGDREAGGRRHCP